MLVSSEENEASLQVVLEFDLLPMWTLWHALGSSLGANWEFQVIALGAANWLQLP